MNPTITLPANLTPDDTRLDVAFKRMCEPWLVLPDVHAALSATIDRLQTIAPQNFFGLFSAEPPKPKWELRDGVAIIPINGTLARKPSRFERMFMGLTGMEDIEAMLEDVAGNSSAKSVLLNIDSGGGSAIGTPELARRVREMNATKPVVTFTGGVMGSAAFYIGASAGDIVASESAAVGGVGTVIQFMDLSKLYEMNGAKREVITNDDSPFKGVGFPGTSLSEKHREYLKEICNESSAQFKGWVRENRKGITDEAMNGKTYSGDKARKLGLCDKIGTMSDAVRIAKMAAR